MPGGRREPLRAIFLKGLLINLLNPKIIIFFVTFLPQFVSAGDPHVARKLFFLGVTFMVVNLPVCGGFILAADRIAAAAQALADARPASSTGCLPACSAPSPRG